MGLHDCLRVVRKRWSSVLVVVGLVLGVAAAITLTEPVMYQSDTRLFISTATGGDSTALLQGSSFSQQRVKSYADVVVSPRVLNPVIAKLNLSTNSESLAKRVSVSVPQDTVLMDVHVQDTSPARAAKIAAEVNSQFIRTVSDLEASRAGRSPVKVSTIAEPTVPKNATSPKPVRNMGLGLAVGLLLGTGLAVLRESLDTRIKGPFDCAAVTSAAVIGGVAYDSEASTHPLVGLADGHSGRAEAFRSLRTNLQYVDAATHPRSIVFTSSVPDEGKTTTAANLASAIAAGGVKVCAVEADLRRPRLLEYMGLEGGVGLTTVLIGQAELDDVLQEFGNMHVLGAGHVPPNPSELLGSRAMQETLRELERRFDVVIIDAPPLLPVTDAAVLSTIADGTVIVVGVGSAKREQLAASMNALEHVNANVLGLVLNKVPTKGPDSYNYTYYREGYGSSPAPNRAKSRKQRKEEEPARR